MTVTFQQMATGKLEWSLRRQLSSYSTDRGAHRAEREMCSYCLCDIEVKPFPELTASSTANARYPDDVASSFKLQEFHLQISTARCCWTKAILTWQSFRMWRFSSSIRIHLQLLQRQPRSETH